jgi:hypothetical protein
MRLLKTFFITQCVIIITALIGCAQNTDPMHAHTTATSYVAPPQVSASAPTLTRVERPQKIKDAMASRGEQDKAQPALKILEPRNKSVITSATVKVKLSLGGELKGYKPMKDPATGMGNHIHVILDNQPYEAHYDLDNGFELRNVSEGKHTLRVFASRPWHESYKNNAAFDTVTFTVKGGGDITKPTTTNNGQIMADGKKVAANTNMSTTAKPSEGKDMPPSQAGNVDLKKPLLTYSRPKGVYKGADADPIMIDFWLKNAKLQGEGGKYRVRYSVDNGTPEYIDKWEPIWLSGWTSGTHTIKLELVDQKGNLVENGGYNSTSREITVEK